ncbi:alkanesulfonate monooxygenase SsuD/methylene tetrahydromethanopterin reductase-like flavin-dependent oxidoreductase (luciferase family) [Actinoplanes lutulentus]|uniref:Alkanesulfonate monooxygenase SsuD/methylene tetrahydromethanopterin reductase-like flavin-dependent oxidoreductase (Luciferase family) n=1 Tax=Actinoplanes lutulentus TaxID=1287878 RepID=A0A327Z135_9ACTN|nr:LLM class flavin-dependent oxidoreductase [Actinoplanes lutulentus]MBB2948918.1 alkanesulfonate monooxygenase SsuD/methylene tetrahydromethanopterin reductase-like flavin-dependent oxidoreductase (luciferase family) [Actinoplanes lutulentus]RAK26299.1 alkanesulfonate monooxygenase SsuD/methylene tetrahydromethanopterin reductase-like flavin-dependent oxidoreductase (luciferase family) [Actinoplanes lutulentus]
MTRLGFNTRVSFPTGEAARGLRDGISLFQAAEALGYQSGWAYQRHFDNYLSSPMPFFAAAGQHTSRILLGSAVIPARFQEPILLAESAGTADLLIDGRLQIAFSSGTDQWDAIFGSVPHSPREEGQRRLARFLSAVAGETIHTVTEKKGVGGPPIGTELKVTPHSPGLRDRIWYGSGSTASAVTAARQGLRLITGTILHDVSAGVSFPQHQADLIAAYRSEWTSAHGTEAPPVAVAASILPGTTGELRDRYAAYDLERRTSGPHASRPQGALTPTLTAALPTGMLMSPVYHGTPEEVTESVLADPGLTAADEIVLFLPPAFELPDNVRLLTDLAETVAPALGWKPS